jgi:hypothetical protein
MVRLVKTTMWPPTRHRQYWKDVVCVVYTSCSAGDLLLVMEGNSSSNYQRIKIVMYCFTGPLGHNKTLSIVTETNG